MHIVDERGRVHSGGDALIILFSIHPKARWRGLAVAGRFLPPVRNKIRRQYRAIADRRGELSDKVADVEPVRVPPTWTRLPGDA